MPKPSMHEPDIKTKKPKRATRKLTNPEGEEKRKWNGQEGGGPGRPPGSTQKNKWGLTPSQMKTAEKIIAATNKDGLFPASVQQLARAIKEEPKRVRDLLRRENFHAYMTHLLLEEGIMLEVAFWRGMQLGLQVGDARVLHLYAQMTGKIQKNAQPTLQVQIVSPDGETLAIPQYTDTEGEEIEDAIVIEDEPDEYES